MTEDYFFFSFIFLRAVSLIVDFRVFLFVLLLVFFVFIFVCVCVFTAKR